MTIYRCLFLSWVGNSGKEKKRTVGSCFKLFQCGQWTETKSQPSVFVSNILSFSVIVSFTINLKLFLSICLCFFQKEQFTLECRTVVHWLWGQWANPRLPQSARKSDLGQHSESLIDPKRQNPWVTQSVCTWLLPRWPECVCARACVCVRMGKCEPVLYSKSGPSVLAKESSPVSLSCDVRMLDLRFRLGLDTRNTSLHFGKVHPRC